jgi:hypothetical protein
MLHPISRHADGPGSGAPRRRGRSRPAVVRGVPVLLAALLPFGLAPAALAAPGMSGVPTAPGRPAAPIAPGIHISPPPTGPALTNEYKVESNRAIAWTGDTAVVTGTDAHGTLYSWNQPDTTSTWNEQIIASGNSGTSYSDAEVATTDTGVMITAVEYHTGSLDFWWQSFGSTTWNEETIASVGQAGYYANPSILSTASGVYIAVGDAGGNIELWYAQYGTDSWTEQIVPHMYSTSYYDNPSVGWNADTEEPVVGADDQSTGDLVAWSLGPSEPNSLQIVDGQPDDAYGPADFVESGQGVSAVFADSPGGIVNGWLGPQASSWGVETVASWFPDSHDYSDPSVVDDDGGELIVANDKSTGGLDAWSGGYPFHEQVIALGASDGGSDDYGQASVAVTGLDYVVVASQENTGSVVFWSSPDGGSDWTQETVA